MKNANKKFNYNVVTIGLCFMMVLFGLGLWGSRGLFVVPITSALGVKRSAYAVTDTLYCISSAIVSIFFGSLVNKFGSKKLICAGFFSFFAATILYAVAEHLFVFYIGSILLGVGLSWTSTTLVGYIVAKAYKKNRGKIMGFVLAANGIGSAITTQVVSPIINEIGNPFGYRNAYYLMALVFAVMFFILLIFYKEPVSKEEDVDEEPKKKARGNSWVGIDYDKATKKFYFYSACICIFFTGIVVQGATGIAEAHMSDVGISVEDIALIASISSLCLAAFKFFNGMIYDKAGLRFSITMDCIAAVVAIFCLYTMTNSSFGVVLGFMYAFFKGMALPLQTVMIPIYAGDLFGEKSYNKILGVFVALNQIGHALGSPIFNFIYDMTGSYKSGLLLCVLIICAVLLTQQFVINAAKKERRLVENPI